MSGCHTPWAMFAHLPEKGVWEHVTTDQVDERIAPDGDPDRNLTHPAASQVVIAQGERVEVRDLPGEP